MAARTRRQVGYLVVALVVLLVGVGIGSFALLRNGGLTTPLAGQRCVASTGQQSVAVSLDQAHFTSIVVGVSVRRGLAPRAASIAMATVYQETGIRNLDYGDRDSVGLFQQRPSQGWGTVAQLMDPYYATGKFYDALVKINGWETGDINDVAQQVQRSGYPEAYRDHEADARVLASALTGQSPAGFSCLERENATGSTKAAVTGLEKTYGQLDERTEGQLVTIRAKNKTLAWAYAHFAVANSKHYGVTGVQVGARTWATDNLNLPSWTAAADGTEVRITVR